MRRLTKKLGLKGLTLHGLRHTFITSLAAQNHSLEKIRLLVGHSNLKTTEKYLHLQDTHLKETMETFLQTRNVESLR
jgi:site-specific recombinase XerD